MASHCSNITETLKLVQHSTPTDSSEMHLYNGQILLSGKDFPPCFKEEAQLGRGEGIEAVQLVGSGCRKGGTTHAAADKEKNK